MILPANGRQRKTRVAVLILTEIEFKPKKVTRDKGGHYIVIKGIIHQKDVTLTNICAPNIGEAKYIKY